MSESLEAPTALLALVSSEEYPTTVEMLQYEGMGEPETGNDETMQAWDEEVDPGRRPLG